MASNRAFVPLSRQLHSSAVARSHIGKVPIPIPSSVTLSLPTPSISPLLAPSHPDATRVITVTGPFGTTTLPIPPPIILSSSAAPGSLTVSVHDPSVKSQRSLWGLTRTLVTNAVTGAATGFTLEVRMVGVGYRGAVEPIPEVFRELARQKSSLPDEYLPTERLNLKLGYSHPVLIDIPPEIKTTVPIPTKIVLSGTDKQKLGQFAAKIRQWRKPEPYRGKGLFVGDETIRLKEIKKK
ncbi:hypothetical protein IAT38_001287 [Cryptococcus sp. DSM 104549]